MERPVRKASALRFVGSVAMFAAAGALAGCEQPGAAAPVAPAEASAPAAAAPASAPVVVDRETDPEAFDLTETTYWDGRPSLGGLWVAHPLVGRPMRVRITNADTGESADGALFRRDAALPGPPILLSYDAAKAIGVKPGVLTRIRVVALKSEAAQKAEAAEETAAPVAATPAATETATANEPASAAAPTPVATAAAPPAPAETAPAPATPPAPVRETRATQSGVPVEPAKTPEPETPPIAPTAPEPPATAEAAVEPSSGAAVAAAAPAAPPTAEAPAVPALKNRFIQIATFKLPVSAERTAGEFRADGVPAEVRQGLAAGETRMSRVLLGPFADAPAQSEAMRKARSRGFKDAYYVDK